MAYVKVEPANRLYAAMCLNTRFHDLEDGDTISLTMKAYGECIEESELAVPARTPGKQVLHDGIGYVEDALKAADAWDLDIPLLPMMEITATVTVKRLAKSWLLDITIGDLELFYEVEDAAEEAIAA